MALWLKNTFPATIFVSFVYYDATCGPSNRWRKLGWWSLPASSDAINVWDIDLTTVNQFVGFYAEQYTDGQGATWDGANLIQFPIGVDPETVPGNYWYQINNGAEHGFNQCLDDNSGCNQLANFFEFNFSGATGVVLVFGTLAGIIETY
jgi:hypothetical protein